MKAVHLFCSARLTETGADRQPTTTEVKTMLRLVMSPCLLALIESIGTLEGQKSGTKRIKICEMANGMIGTRSYFLTPTEDGCPPVNILSVSCSYELKSGPLFAKSSQSHLSMSSNGTSGTVVPKAVPARFTASTISSSDIAEKCTGSDQNTDGENDGWVIVTVGSYPSNDEGDWIVSGGPIVPCEPTWLCELDPTGARRISSLRNLPYRTDAPLR